LTLLNLLASRSSRMKASEIRELLKLLDQPDIISFAGGIPDPALFPAEAIRDAYASVLGGGEAGAALQYQVSEGYLPLRRWLAGQMGKLGVACDEANIFITSGSQQALDYLGKLFLSPGDTALVTWPTYLGALQAFNAYEPRYDRLNTAGGNMTPEAYRAAAAAPSTFPKGGGKVKFAYLVPDFANPTGNTLDARQREAVLDLAGELDIAVIEDAAYRALRYDGEGVPPILALDCARSDGIDHARTLYCGSFSKILSPGMRVGWVCAPRRVVERLVLMKQASDLHSPSINQVAMHRAAEAVFDAQVEKLIGAYRQRRDGLLGTLEAKMPSDVSWSRPDGGMFVWVTLPEGSDATALLARSVKEARVAFVPGNAFFADGSGRNTLRLSFTLADQRVVSEGIPRLAKLLG
jgi:DNA-binding transcriptional MocR family regulator